MRGWATLGNPKRPVAARDKIFVVSRCSPSEFSSATLQRRVVYSVGNFTSGSFTWQCLASAHTTLVTGRKGRVNTTMCVLHAALLLSPWSSSLCGGPGHRCHIRPTMSGSASHWVNCAVCSSHQVSSCSVAAICFSRPLATRLIIVGRCNCFGIWRRWIGLASAALYEVAYMGSGLCS